MTVDESLEQVERALMRLAGTLRQIRTETRADAGPGAADIERSLDIGVLPKIDAWLQQLSQARAAGIAAREAEVRHLLQRIYGIARLIDMDLSWSSAGADFDRESAELVNLAAAADKVIRERAR